MAAMPSNSDRPTLSVVTATYNSMKYFKDTEQSVLKSEVFDLEWIIIDDASTDGTADYLSGLKDKRIRLFLNKQNKGIGYSYETGVNMARGKYVLILDHDDTIPLGSLSSRIKLLDKYPESNVAFGLVSYMDESGCVYAQSSFLFAGNNSLLSSTNVLLGIFILPSYPLKQGCVILRREFMEKNPGVFDIAIFLRAIRSGPVIFLNKPCLNYRTFRNQYSSSRKMRVIKFFHFYWARYAFKYLPWYFSPFAAAYRTVLELAKVIWSLATSKRV